MLGAAAAELVSELAGAVGLEALPAGCEATDVLELWSTFEAVPVDGVSLVTGGVVLAGACPAVSVAGGCEAAAPCAAVLASGAAAELVGAAALSADGFADMPEELLVWHLSETMLTLCMVMVLLLPELLEPAPAPVLLLLDCDSFTCPVMETV